MLLLDPCLVALDTVVLGCRTLRRGNSAAQMLVVLSDESASYQEIVEELRTSVVAVRVGRVRLDVVTARSLADAGDSALSGAELVVTVGLSAAQATIARENVLARPPPTLCLLIPRQSFQMLPPSLGSGRDRRLSAVFIDQPLARQLDLIRIALPEKTRVGVILGPSSELLRDELRENVRERGLIAKLAEVSESASVYGALQKVLPDSDLLLALPDPVAVNASTAYGLLLTSYRAQIPVVGFSEGMVKAGALLACSRRRINKADRERRPPVAFLPARRCPRRSIRSISPCV